MKALFLMLAGLLGLQVAVLSQSVFNHEYDSKYNNQPIHDGVSNALITSDGYILVAGTSGKSSLSYSAASIIKLNSRGDTIWWKQWAFSNPYGSHANRILEASDGNYIAYGRSQDSTGQMPDLYLMKLDTAGNIIWRETYSFIGIQASYDIKATPDGGYLLTGWTADCANCFEDAFLLKVDSLGQQQWYKRYGGNFSDYVYSMEYSPGGGYVLCGSSYNNGIGRTWLVKVDEQGQQQWARTYQADSWGRGVTRTLDGGYALAGAVRDANWARDAYLIKTDSLGFQQWYYRYQPPVYGYEFFGYVRQRSDSTLLVMGNMDTDTALATDRYRTVLWAFTLAGVPLWQRTYDHPGIGSDNFAYDLQLLPSGGVIMPGDVVGNPLSQLNSAWVCTTDACGYTTNNAPQPVAAFTTQPLTSFTWQFQNQTTDGCTFRWRFGDGDSSRVASPQHTYPTFGTYTVELITCAGNNCDTITQILTVLERGEVIQQKAGMELYPNPAIGLFTVRLNQKAEGCSLSLRSLLGVEVLKMPVVGEGQEVQINTTGLPAGLYHVRLEQNALVLQNQMLVVNKL